MGRLRLVGALKLWVSFAKEPYERDDILQKRPIILMSLLIVATPYGFASGCGFLYSYSSLLSVCVCVCVCVRVCVWCVCVRYVWVCVCVAFSIHIRHCSPVPYMIPGTDTH